MNLESNATQPGLATPPPTAPSVATSNTPPPASPTATAPAAAADPPGPTPPSGTLGELADVYLTTHARSSQGVHPTDLQVLPDIIGADESRTWFVVTVGCYTGVYLEWYIPYFLNIWLTLIRLLQASSEPPCHRVVWCLLQAVPDENLGTCGL